MPRSAVDLVLALALAIVGCASPSGGEPPLVAADKSAGVAAANGGTFAFLDGLEGSSDPSETGVDVRVVDGAGGSMFASSTAGAVRALVLTGAAVVTLEFGATIDEHVEIRPLSGAAPIAMTHAHPPLALAAAGDRLVWIEAQLAKHLAPDGSIADTGELELELVEADPRGDVLARRPVVVPGGIPVTPWDLYSVLPSSFGLIVDGDVAYFGWAAVIGRGAQVLRIERATGAASVAWQGRGRVDDTDPAEVGEALGVVGGALVVTGAIRAYASIADDGGFVATGGTTLATADAVRFAAGDGTALVVATPAEIDRFDGAALAPVPFVPHAPIDGLATDGVALAITTRDGLFVHPL